MKELTLIILTFALTLSAGYQLQPRMLGGVPAELDSLPYLATIKHFVGSTTTKFCLGSIIDDKWILTSALCALTTNPRNLVVEVGSYTHPSEFPDQYQVRRVFFHPNFDSTTGKHDLGLIQLCQNIEFSPKIYPIELGTIKNEDGQFLVPGWGEDVENGWGQGKPVPLQVSVMELNLTSMQQCSEEFHELHEVVDLDDEYQICTYGGKGSDLCGPDFGAPLVDQESGVLVGVFNDVIFMAGGHGHNCHPDHDHPLLFTKIEPYLEWINRCIRRSGMFWWK